MLVVFYTFQTLALAAIAIPFSKNSIVKRSSPNGGLDSNGVGYFINFTLGGQNLQSQLDTGSSDVWVPDVNGCQPSKDVDCEFTFNPRDSRSFHANQSDPFQIQYGDKSGAKGIFAQDDFVFGSATVTGMNFALATEASANSVFGVGLPAGEAMVRNSIGGREPLSPYRNLPYQMRDQGLIGSAAYSVWLGSPGKYNGEIVFGGVDHSRYTGDLITFPIEKEPYEYFRDGTARTYPDRARMLVLLNKLAVEIDGNSETLMEGVVPVLLDTGATTSHGPAGLVRAVNAALGLSGRNQDVMKCGAPKGDLVITIKGVDLRVPLNTFISPLFSYSESEIADSQGDLACGTGFSADPDSTFFAFGDNILRALYLVYDLENMEISLAQSNWDSGDSDIEDITGQVPGAKRANDYSSEVSSYNVQLATRIRDPATFTDLKSISGDLASVTTIGGDDGAEGYAETTTDFFGAPFGGHHSGSVLPGGASASQTSSSSSQRNGALPTRISFENLVLSLLMLI